MPRDQQAEHEVADESATREAIATLLVDGPIQIVVNNAGIHDDAPLAGMSAEQWRRVIDVSLHGFFHVTQPLLLPMAPPRMLPGYTDTLATTAGGAIATLLDAGPIQVVVNNAGIHDDAPLAGMSAAQWRRVIDVSLHGFFHVTQPLLLPMARTRWGRIVSVSSVAAVLGNRGQANYAAAKSALHGATKSLAREMASRNITVNVVAPGVVEGAMAAEAFAPEAIKQMVPAGRAAKPDEIAAVVRFLCSEAASYVNGQVIGVDGGMT